MKITNPNYPLRMAVSRLARSALLSTLRATCLPVKWTEGAGFSGPASNNIT